MAGKIPSFITGANAKIKVAGITIAYAQDVSYSTTVTTIPIETMGRYEVVSNEPVAYFVDGGLSVIRYTNIADGDNGPGQAAATGNSVAQWAFSGNPERNAFDHFNPGKLLVSETWDLEIFQKNGEGDPVAVVKLRDCRFTRKGGAINKRGILVEQFAFNAILADEEAGAGDNQAQPSGDQDLQP